MADSVHNIQINEFLCKLEFRLILLTLSNDVKAESDGIEHS